MSGELRGQTAPAAVRCVRVRVGRGARFEDWDPAVALGLPTRPQRPGLNEPLKGAGSCARGSQASRAGVRRPDWVSRALMTSIH